MTNGYGYKTAVSPANTGGYGYPHPMGGQPMPTPMPMPAMMQPMMGAKCLACSR